MFVRHISISRPCHVQDSLDGLPELNKLLRRDLGAANMYLSESCDLYSLDDIPRAVNGEFVHSLEAAIGSLKALAEMKSIVSARMR